MLLTIRYISNDPPKNGQHKKRHHDFWMLDILPRLKKFIGFNKRRQRHRCQIRY